MRVALLARLFFQLIDCVCLVVSLFFLSILRFLPLLFRLNFTFSGKAQTDKADMLSNRSLFLITPANTLHVQLRGIPLRGIKSLARYVLQHACIAQVSRYDFEVQSLNSQIAKEYKLIGLVERILGVGDASQSPSKKNVMAGLTLLKLRI